MLQKRPDIVTGLINMFINYYGDYGDLACKATNQQEIIFIFYKIEFVWSIVMFISRCSGNCHLWGN